MEFKVTLILKSGVKHKINYEWPGIKSLSEAQEFISALLKDDNNAFVLTDGTRSDFYIKESISVLSIEEEISSFTDEF